MKQLKALKTVVALAILTQILRYVLHISSLQYVSLALLFLGLISDKASLLIDKIWGKVTGVIGTVLTFFVMSLTFYLILSPLAWFARKLQDPLNFKAKGSASYFVARPHLYTAPDFEKLW